MPTAVEERSAIDLAIDSHVVLLASAFICFDGRETSARAMPIALFSAPRERKSVTARTGRIIAATHTAPILDLSTDWYAVAV
jgi:hypothetical protein